MDSIILRNFQAHEYLRIEFDPLVTTITGPSDIGKSSIIRALRWACLNTPAGDSFIRDGADNVSVSVSVNGTTIERRKGKKGNLYRLDGSDFKSFGSGVPEPVEKRLVVDDTNFQSQHDASFWFSLSAGEVSRRLNSIVDLDIIDTALDAVKKRVRRSQQALDVCDTRLKIASSDVESLKWVSDADNHLKAVESLQSEIARFASERDELLSAVQSIKNLKRTQQDASSQLSDLTRVGRLGQSAIRSEDDYLRLHKELAETSLLVTLANKEVPGTEDLDRCMEAYNKASADVIEFGHVLRLALGAKSILKKREIEYADAYEELMEMTEGLCPICGRRLLVT